MDLVAKRFDVFLINLDPTIGREIKKTRSCLIVSPDEMNQYLQTLIVAPMTSKGRNYPTRIPCSFKRKSGQIILDQIRTIDRRRLVRKLGVIDKKTASWTLGVLSEMFES
ncbi:MAG: transcriptional regulator [Deltaproteobacteria bacterium CG11_big_fil_rev_8_21_14_0_20_45_16]|nr:MAG: transcriptional regulator [Deltaproteobacteria bacterium CG11_big_fil_rev_8_21_14_0_20_45_16]